MRRILCMTAVGVLLLGSLPGAAKAQVLYDVSAIASLEFSVFDGPGGALLASGQGMWDSGIWILDGIPAGTDRSLRVTTYNELGKATYVGTLSGIAIDANFPFSADGALILMAVPEGIYVLVPPFTAAGVVVLYPLAVEVVVDIKPGSTKNPFNTRSAGVTPVVILGGPDVDVEAIDTATLRLGGVAPTRWRLTDACTLVVDEASAEMSEEGPDGYTDLLLHFDNADLAAVIGGAANGEFVPLVLSGQTLDGVHVEGVDGVTVIAPPATPPKGKRP